MNALIGLVDLLNDQEPIVVLAKAAQPVTPAAHGAHEVQPEAIDARLRFVGLELGSAANALPHGPSVLPARPKDPADEQ